MPPNPPPSKSVPMACHSPSGHIGPLSGEQEPSEGWLQASPVEIN